MSGAICQKFVRPTYDDRREILTGSSRLCLKDWKKFKPFKTFERFNAPLLWRIENARLGLPRLGFFTTDTTRRRLSCLGGLESVAFTSKLRVLSASRWYGGRTRKDLNRFRPTLLWLQLLHIFFWARPVSYRRAFFVCKLKPRPGSFSSSAITLYRYRPHVLFQRNC